MIDKNRNMNIDEKYIYEDDEGKQTYDFCESCNRPVLQEDLGDGIYGCEFCKSANQISINQINKNQKVEKAEKERETEYEIEQSKKIKGEKQNE